MALRCEMVVLLCEVGPDSAGVRLVKLCEKPLGNSSQAAWLSHVLCRLCNASHTMLHKLVWCSWVSCFLPHMVCSSSRIAVAAAGGNVLCLHCTRACAYRLTLTRSQQDTHQRQSEETQGYMCGMPAEPSFVWLVLCTMERTVEATDQTMRPLQRGNTHWHEALSQAEDSQMDGMNETGHACSQMPS